MTDTTTNDIRELQKQVVDFRDARDWKQFHNPKDLAIALIIEAGELLEHFRYKSNEEVAEHIDTNKDEVANELSDVLYHVLLMAHDLKIDISESFLNKLEDNGKKYPVEKSSGNHKKYTELN